MKNMNTTLELPEGSKATMLPIQKIEYSIALLKKAEPLALKMDERGFHLAFSGGKDSQVLYELAKMAGVKFHAEMQVTTLDPPELMKFVRNNYPDVKMNLPEMNFYKLIRKKGMLPLRQARYCCAYLKEQAGRGSVRLIGIRAAESVRRSKRPEVEIAGRKGDGYMLDQFNRTSEQEHQCISGMDSIIISPILRWSDADVWNFIRGKGLEYCSLYDKGYHRIGCMFCPMANRKSKALDRKNYPGVEREIKKSIQWLIDNKDYMKDYNATADEIFNLWFLGNTSSAQYFGMLRNQMKLKF
jgi:phosphoadenosine phosphosulfate reductase